MVRFVSCLLLALSLCLAQAPQTQLLITAVTLHQYEDGPPIPPGHAFIPGDTVFLSFQVRGYRVSDKERVLIEHRVEAVDPKGVLLAEPATGRIDSEVSPEDKDWQPKIRRSVLVPPFSDSGTYRLLITVRDVLGEREAKAEAPFNVRGRSVEPSDTLVARNFRFLRGEEDAQPLAIPAYRGGDTLWARFEITGYKTGPNNRYRVSYGLSVLNAEGKVLFTQPEAAAEEESPFYPKRYVPGVLSLQLKPKTTPGEYTLLVSLRDEVGGQTAESRHTFRIE